MPEILIQCFRDGGIPGGEYTARQERDGTWTILDVPIFAELPAGARRNPDPVGLEWMERAIARHALLEREQKHLAPVHVNHHGDGMPTQRIGFLRLRRTGTVRLDGRDRTALFADIVGVKEIDLERIRDVDLPFRSVEVVRWERPEIASLALMADESPFFKLPMLTLGREERLVGLEPEELPACAAAAFGEYDRILFSFHGGVMKFASSVGERIRKAREEKELTIQELAARMNKILAGGSIDPSTIGDIETGRIQTPSSPVLGAIARVLGVSKESLVGAVSGDEEPDSEGRFEERRMAKQKKAGTKFQDNDHDKDKENGNGDEKEKLQEGDIKEQIGNIATFIKDLSPLMKAMMQLVSGGASEEGNGGPADQPAGAAAGTMRDVERNGGGKSGKDASGKDAASEARLSALEDRIEKRERAEKLEALVDGHLEKLRDEGWEVSEKTAERFRAIVDGHPKPEQAAKDFADTYRENSPKDPPESADDFRGEPGGKADEVVTKFAEKGPETLAEARRLGAEYDQLKAAGFDLKESKETFIEVNLKQTA